jgi:hypothetical protein
MKRLAGDIGACHIVSAGTSFADLLPDLQSLIYAYSSAPLLTCRASAAVGKSQHFIGTWLLNSGKQNALLAAARAKHWSACMIILDRQPRHRPPELAQTLSLAAAGGSLELVTKLLQQGAWADWAWSGHCQDHTFRMSPSQMQQLEYLNQQEVEAVRVSRHPLYEAAAHGHLDICHLFLSGKELPCQVLKTALSAAAYRGHLPVVELLYQTDPAVSMPSSGENIMRDAAVSGNLLLVQFLLDTGGDVNGTPGTLWSELRTNNSRENKSWCRPIYTAAACGNADVLQLLVDRGAALEPCWHEALAVAAQNGRMEAARLLLHLAETAMSTSPWDQLSTRQEQGGSGMGAPSTLQQPTGTGILCSCCWSAATTAGAR